MNPTSGSTLGGTALTLTGTGFVSGATVSVGGAAATLVWVATSTLITARTPAHTRGFVEVSVTTVGGTATRAFAFAYMDPNFGTFRGAVSESATTMISGAVVAAYQGTTLCAQASTDAAGMYTLRVGAGEYTLRFTKSGYRDGERLRQVIMAGEIRLGVNFRMRR